MTTAEHAAHDRQRSYWWVLKTAVKDWASDNAARLSAAVAFYTMISLAPLLVIAVYVAGVFFGQGQARQTMLDQVTQSIGPQAAELMGQMMDQAQTSGHGVVAITLSIITLVVGATAVFGALQGALDRIWEVKPQGRNAIWGFIRKRLLSLLMVGLIGLLLLATVVLSAVISSLAGYAEGTLPGSAVLWQVLNIVVSVVVLTVLFAAIFKLLPDVKIQWKDVWIGAALTAVLFEVGKFLIGLYLGRSAATSAYGAAGALALILLWVYYSGLIFFLGAEITQAYARAQGRRIEPEEHAVRLPEAHKTA